jgi:chromosome partitioning protein
VVRGAGKKVKLGVCLACGNQKGGVGKSTVAVHLAAALGLEGYQCLVVDLDPAAGATRHLGVPEASFAGTLELLTTDEHLAALVIEQDMPRNVHLVPARGQLAELDSLLSKFVDRTRILDRILGHAREFYDFIIFDTSPSAGATTTIAAYAACEWFLLTAFPHPLSFAGLTEACRDIRDVRQYRNPELEVLGVVFNNVDPRARLLRVELDSLVEQLLPGRRFKTTISQAVILPHLSGMGRTLFQEDNWQRLVPARQYHRLAMEVLHRVKHRDEFIGGRLDEFSDEADNPPIRLKDNVVSLRTEVKHG